MSAEPVVPEQGLREALEQITAVFKPPAIQYAREEYWFNRAKRMAEIARAALERPRPALPAPSLEAARKLHELLGDPDDPITDAHLEHLRDALRVVYVIDGAALPPQTGNPPPDFAELIAAARFALKECEEITSSYPHSGDFWGLADNAAQELRRALAGEAVSAYAKAITAPQPPVDVERLNRAVDTMMEQAKNLREALRGNL